MSWWDPAHHLQAVFPACPQIPVRFPSRISESCSAIWWFFSAPHSPGTDTADFPAVPAYPVVLPWSFHDLRQWNEWCGSKLPCCFLPQHVLMHRWYRRCLPTVQRTFAAPLRLLLCPVHYPQKETTQQRRQQEEHIPVLLFSVPPDMPHSRHTADCRHRTAILLPYHSLHRPAVTSPEKNWHEDYNPTHFLWSHSTPAELPPDTSKFHDFADNSHIYCILLSELSSLGIP